MTELNVASRNFVNALKNSMLCSNIASKWILEQAALFVYALKWLVFVTERECVYWAVWTESLYAVQINISLQRFNRHVIYLYMN
jgi:hypothetical protein